MLACISLDFKIILTCMGSDCVSFSQSTNHSIKILVLHFVRPCSTFNFHFLLRPEQGSRFYTCSLSDSAPVNLVCCYDYRLYSRFLFWREGNKRLGLTHLSNHTHSKATRHEPWEAPTPYGSSHAKQLPETKSPDSLFHTLSEVHLISIKGLWERAYRVDKGSSTLRSLNKE